MFFPVGPRPPSVYWRRRLLLVAGIVAILVLIVLTTKAVVSGDSGSTGGPGPQAGGTTRTGTPTPSPQATGAASPTTSPASSPAAVPSTTPASSSPVAPVSSPSAVAPQCNVAQLHLAATVAQPTYQVGAEPVLGLQITNPGPQPCVQDVADSQIVMTVYNGASRVWGSHDCQVQPGVMQRTFNPSQPAVFTITWSGLSSQANCAGTRQRVGAGTYTLYATLAGQQATAAQFAIS
ncbi:MAG: hypothetical protein EPN43_10395 [Jatrophihabitans sp.]|nr:MAG: hypothetical protein EPN43_10395 [Jatrophihabitans sp.]